MSVNGNRRAVRDVLLLGTAGGVSTVAQIGRGLLLAALLGPRNLGTVTIVVIVLAYAQWADFGCAMAATREIPAAVGARRFPLASEWVWYGRTLKMVASILVALGLGLYVGICGSGLDADLRFGLWTAVLVVVLQAVQASTTWLLQARREFARATLLANATNIANLALCVVGAAAYGVEGVFVGQAAAFALGALLSFVLLRARRPRPLRVVRLRTLLTVGIPLAALSVEGYVLINIDQLIVVGLLGRTPLGVYSIVLFVGAVVAMVPMALAGAVSPRLIESWGANPSPEVLKRLTWLPADVLSFALPPLIAAVWLGGPPLIEWLLPQFDDAVAPLRLYLVGAFFWGVNLGVSSTLLTMKKHAWNVPIMAGCIALNAVVDFVLVLGFGMGLSGVAIGSAFTYMIYWAVHTAVVAVFLQHSRATALARIARLGWPGAVLWSLALGQWWVGDLSSAFSWGSVMAAVAVWGLTLARLRSPGTRALLSARRGTGPAIGDDVIH